MRPIESLRGQLEGLDGKDYAAYQSLLGSYRADRFELHLDRIPKDPYAPLGTGTFRLSVLRSEAAFPEGSYATPPRRVALRDYLARRFGDACARHSPGRRGTGNSGIIGVAPPGQAILERSSVQVSADHIEVRLFLGLPASGRKIDAATAQAMLLDELPRVAAASLFAGATDLEALERHLQAVEDARHLRARLAELDLVAFVADGSVLPRASGVDPRPLRADTARPFTAPPGLRVSVDLPHAGTVTGMGIPRGVTLIVGGGYHGKSTLLQALELGIYDHVPGDGRELCVSLPSAVKVRAASGRSVATTDISAYIDRLPLEQDTVGFSSENASGSTSQAASIAESIEAGAHLLLMDEDTSAANFMIRDARMQRLVAREHEPITAFVDVVRRLYHELGVSTILVMGGSGDYFDVADRVIQMMEFEPRDVTAQAHAIARAVPTERRREGNARPLRPLRRAPDGTALDPRNEYGHVRIAARDPQRLRFGRLDIDLTDVEQIVEAAQTRAIGRALEHVRRYLDGRTPLRDALARVSADLQRGGLDLLDPRCAGDLASFRELDLAAALNRVRGLDVRTPE